MIARLTAMWTLVFTVSTTAVAGAADKPLRSMSFDVGYSVVSSSERNSNGVTGGGGSGGEFNVDDAGSMTIDVVAVTGDGGLVVDAAYAGKVTHQRAVRVAIFSDGRLAYNPAQPPSPQVLYVLPMLARGIFSSRDIEKGATWSTKIDEPVATTVYRVLDVAAPVATFSVERDVTTPAGRGYQEHETGTVRYATDVLAPLRVDMFIHSRRTTLDRIETADTHLLATLKSDSFSPSHT